MAVDNCTKSKLYLYFYWKIFDQECKKIFFKVGKGKLEWVNDGLCDDMNNNEACNYDGGDCCGVNIAKHFCAKCECKRKSLTNITDSWFAIVALPKYFSP